MSDGIVVDDAVKQALKEALARPQKFNTLFCRISEDFSKIVLESSGTMTYDEVLAQLPANETRYVIHEFAYRTRDNASKTDFVLLSWHPETANIKSKMVLASTLTAFKAELGFHKVLEADNLEEASRSAIEQHVGAASSGS
ncbi:hypothetical protein AB0940_34170 [Streptomyces sp. NPDC006656]|uniref:hypothetical protein n=1 Tax=Streptomyces sp. NPDC006656 TaxID=3156899 RepID=UPI0034520FEB